MIVCPCCGKPLDYVAMTAVTIVDGEPYLFPVCSRCHAMIEGRQKMRALLFASADRRIAADPDRVGAMLFPSEYQARMACGLASKGQMGIDTISTFWGPQGAGKGQCESRPAQ
jgi:hypothetical protein